MSIAKAKSGFIEPMLALAVTKLPEGVAWSYELKFDGYRAIGVKAAAQNSVVLAKTNTISSGSASSVARLV
jgi:ATP-dependent DNA ligase